MSIVLRNCPFCGSNDMIISRKGTNYDDLYIQCGLCDAQGPPSRVEGRELWNTRVKSTTPKEFHALVDKIPGDDGWWKSSAGETYRKTGDDLLEKGLTNDEVLEILSDLFSATSWEFGN